ncbi:MAG: PilZ domain-containing protein [Deltaproteobacteria bacterium]|nr:PilZ domain-containing protein [Deltaproteobacteria bacterium]
MSTEDRRQGRPDQRADEKQAERRKGDRRRNVRVPVNIWIEEHKDGDLYFQQAGNLSVGGVFFERTIPHPKGTRVRLRFELPGREGLIETVGEVVSAPEEPGEQGAGIRFVDLDPVEERLIRAFVEQSLAEQDEQDEQA